MTLSGEVRQPVEGPLDRLALEAGFLEVLGELFTLGHVRVVDQHVAVEDIDKDVEYVAVVGHGAAVGCADFKASGVGLGRWSRSTRRAADDSGPQRRR